MRIFYAFLSAFLVMTPLTLRASTLFSLSPNLLDYYGEAGGVGQGVTVSTTTQLQGFAFYLSTQGAPTQVTYQIWNGTNTSVLYSNTLTVSSTTQSWVVDSLSFTLNAGSTYYFAFEGPAFFNFGLVNPPQTYSANGLTAVPDAASYFNNKPDNPFTNDDLGLELFGTQSIPAATPEPASIALLASGLALGASFIRRRPGLA